MQGSCPAALIQSASLVGLAGYEHCKGLGGNVWGIQAIALSPFSLCDGSGWLGQRTGPSHNTSGVDPSTTQRWKVCSAEAVHPTSHQYTQTAHER